MKCLESFRVEGAGPSARGLDTTVLRPTAGLPAIRHRLERRGIALVQAEPGDAEGRTMRRIVDALGVADPHQAGGRTVWDVRYDPTAAGDVVARSLTTKPFPFHTDGSFEEPPPRYVALYVVRGDRLGGGATLLLEASSALRNVSPSTRHVLRSTRFRFLVPAEFDKGVPHLDASILIGEGLARYRREILDESVCTRAQVQALDELDAALAATNPARLLLPCGMLLLLDNARFLHARTEVLDPARHLLRMRFSPGGSAGVPA